MDQVYFTLIIVGRDVITVEWLQRKYKQEIFVWVTKNPI